MIVYAYEINLRNADFVRIECILILAEHIQWVNNMNLPVLQKACLGKTIHTPKSCKKIYLKQLIKLCKRFAATSNALEGGEHFLEDIQRLVLNMQDLLAAGIGKAHDVKFQKWSITSVYEVRPTSPPQ